tara:strand:- start:1077 stop:1241 length:165 start_codon:yes stop_codon:yes gene_type:complete
LEALEQPDMKKNKKKTIRPRNLVAVAAFQRSGAGRHKDKKKEAARKACRNRNNW